MQAVVREEFLSVQALPQLSMHFFFIFFFPDWEIEGF